MFLSPGSRARSRPPASQISGGLAYNIKDFGAGAGGDDTAAVQAAIDASVRDGIPLYAQGGAIYYINKLDLTELGWFKFLGDGWQTTRFMPLPGNSYNAASGHLFDCTGSANLQFSGFQVGAFNQSETPATCFHLSQTAANLANAFHFEGLYITGKYVTSPFYSYGVPSSTMVNCDWYNYTTSASTWTGVWDSTNSAGLTSTFATVTSGSKSTSDWNMFGCEWHRFGGNSNGYTLSFRETAVTNIQFYGGNVTGGGAAYFVITAASAPPSNIWFNGVTFETESEPTPTNIGDLVGGLVDGIELPGCSYIVTNKTFGSSSNGAFKPKSGGLPWIFVPSGTIAANTTEYLGPATKDASEANAFFVAPQAGLLTQARFSCTASPGAGKTFIYHLMVNSAASTLTATISDAATSASDLVHFVRVEAGDTISVRAVTLAGANVGHHRASMTFVPLN